MYIYYYYYYYYSLPALTSGLSLQSYWQQMFSGLHDYSQNSWRSQQYGNPDSVNSSSNVQLHKSFPQSREDRAKRIKYDLYNSHTHLPQFIMFSDVVQVFFLFFRFLWFSPLWSVETAKSRRL